MAFARRTPAAWAIHPGEILKKEFLQPLELSGYRLAKELGVPSQTVNDITLYKRGISAEMAILLAKFFGTSELFWMNLQASFDLADARQNSKARLSRIKPYRKPAQASSEPCTVFTE